CELKVDEVLGRLDLRPVHAQPACICTADVGGLDDEPSSWSQHFRDSPHRACRIAQVLEHIEQHDDAVCVRLWGQLIDCALEHLQIEPAPSGRGSNWTQLNTADLPTALSGRVEEMPLRAPNLEKFRARLRLSNLLKNHLVQTGLSPCADIISS